MKKEQTNKSQSCPGMNEQSEDQSCNNKGMEKCMKGAKYFLLIPGIVMAIAFLLGYFFEPATVRMLWLVASGSLLLLGTIFYISINIWGRRLNKQSGI